MLNKRLLQFQAPKESEPLCSGLEARLALDQRIDLAHFHTVVTVIVGRPRASFFSSGSGLSLNITATINGREYDKQVFVVSQADLGKTLFCAGFPCLTVTGLDQENNLIMVNLSEIVEPCEPGNCPWGND